MCLVLCVSGLSADEYTRDGLYARFMARMDHGELNEMLARPDSSSGESYLYSHGYIYSYTADVAIGYTFFNSLIPHLNFFRSGSIELETNSQETDFYLQGWGYGLTYYFMPINISISYTTGFITSGRWHPISADSHPYKAFRGSDNSQPVSSAPISALFTISASNLTIGKEFFVSPQYSIGIVLSRQTYNFRVKGAYTDLALVSSDYSIVSYGVGFVLTYN